jgi:cytochrome c-type biogenesis protein CcmH/NrfG
MYSIVPLVLICASLAAIIIIIVRKFPELANLDVENMPAEKEARFKEQIITGRMQKNLIKLKVGLGRIFVFIGGKISALYGIVQAKLQEAKKNYSAEKAPLPVEDKEKVIADLLLKNENLDNHDDFENKESNLIKIIELDPRRAEVFARLGDLYLSDKKYEEAKQAFVHALKLLGNEDVDGQSEIYYDLSAVYRETGELADSLETIKMAAKLSPNNPRYLDSLAEISIINKDKISAREALGRLAEANPENGKLIDYEARIKEME